MRLQCCWRCTSSGREISPTLADKKKVRATFNNFFKIASDFYSDESNVLSNPTTDHAHEDCICGCGKGCTARVIQAFALFESKNKLKPKSKFLIKRAIEFDPNLESILKWKMFEDVPTVKGSVV
ncbi:hypothetical protein TL16_g06725 [Triparma laevis f. inornata]|uniref:Uncharacterized protein n=1 Tax=Triparma laevis f. inornata TaxID=1714386 RepID=A0A9W7ASR2_9STRA|nr:hypothetical protein TL16_g06725 [Triparma laevis f. inornata]